MEKKGVLMVYANIILYIYIYDEMRTSIRVFRICYNNKAGGDGKWEMHCDHNV